MVDMYGVNGGDANAVVSRSIPPNTVAAGAPAAPMRTFDGPVATVEPQPPIRVTLFGTSIMEHFEGFSTKLVNQATLPDIGSKVVVEGWHQRGWVQRLQLGLQVAWPCVWFTWDNLSSGGTTSRDILNIVREHTATQPRSDLIILGCGINDVWRGFQGRTEQAVPLDEYAANYDAILRLVSKHARTVVCIAETPFGWDADLDATAMNVELARYNATAHRLAAEHGASFLDVWPDFVATARQLGAGADPGPGNPSLWSDGVHLSELGDALLLRLAERHLEVNNVIAKLTPG